MRRTRILAAAFALAACSKAKDPPKYDPPAPTKPTTPADASLQMADLPADAAVPDAPPTPSRPQVTMPDAKKLAPLVSGNNSFGFTVWRKLDAAQNLAFSPTSISVALAMTATGARSATATEMKQVMGVPGLDDAALAQGWGDFAAALQSDGRGITLRMANRLFGEQTYTFEAPYLALTKDAFRAPFEPTDFVGALEPSRMHINTWVADQTAQKIKDLIPAGGLTADTRLVLVNAIYMLANWAEEFDPRFTTGKPFTAPKPHDVPMMMRTDWYEHAEVDGTTLVELPYQDNTTSMLVVMPKDLAAAEQKLTAESFQAWRSKLAGKRIALSLPKFKIDPPAAVELSEVLVDLGIKDAFNKDKADFTGMANPKSPADRLYISKVFHKAFVAIDEKGTEAAAATAVVMAKAGSAAPTEPPPAVTFDRPFLFFVIDRASGLVMFMGRVVDPAM
jgi:serpin B